MHLTRNKAYNLGVRNLYTHTMIANRWINSWCKFRLHSFRHWEAVTQERETIIMMKQKKKIQLQLQKQNKKNRESFVVFRFLIPLAFYITMIPRESVVPWKGWTVPLKVRVLRIELLSLCVPFWKDCMISTVDGATTNASNTVTPLEKKARSMKRPLSVSPETAAEYIERKTVQCDLCGSWIATCFMWKHIWWCLW